MRRKILNKNVEVKKIFHLAAANQTSYSSSDTSG